ncbi:MAG: metal-dependent hydrolase [Burkholderiales bacterium]
MFIGHFAIAFAAKPAAPSASLGTLFFACEWVDLVWPLFLLAGLERVEIRPGVTAFTPLDFIYYPWTHSLVMCTLWAAAFGLLYLSIRKSGRAALVLAAVVLSHWFLDLIVHRPDLPLAPGSDARFGLGLWNSIPGTLLVEAGLFIAALLLYLRRTRALDRIGRWGLWGLILFLAAAYLGAAFGPPPPDANAIAWAGILGGAVTAFLGYWVDRHRAMAG